MNFSRKRPETTNLNHQYAIRRVFMACHPRDHGAPHTVDSARAAARV